MPGKPCLRHFYASVNKTQIYFITIQVIFFSNFIFYRLYWSIKYEQILWTAMRFCGTISNIKYALDHFEVEEKLKQKMLEAVAQGVEEVRRY